MKVNDLNKQEQPREKAWQQGIESLSNRELIAVLLRTGTKDISALELADEILQACDNVGELGKLSVEELMHIKGIKKAKAIALQAGFEVGRRIAFDKIQKGRGIECPQDIVNWLSQQIGFDKQEHFLVLFLNQKNQVLKYRAMFVGTLTNASVHPREIYKEAMRIGCAKILCVHNHPSGDPTESDADIELTKSIEACGKIVAIPLMDHIIISNNSYISFRQKRLID